MSEKFSITITTGAVIKIIAVLIMVVFVYFIRDIMMSVLFSLVIASGVDPAATWFQKRKIPRVLAVIFVYLIAFSFLGGMFYLIIPNTFKELASFADNFPVYLEKPFEAGTVDKIFGNLPSFIRDALGGFLSNISDYISSFSTGFFGIASHRGGRSGIVYSHNCPVFLSINAGKRGGKFLEDSYSGQA